MLLLILFAFLGGLVTILSPCILPILPIILSGSLTGGHRRPLGIITGFVVSFTFFTLFLAAIVNTLGIPSDSLRLFSIIVIGLLGMSLVVPQTQLLLEKVFSGLANFFPRTSTTDGFWGGLVIGLSLGLLWTPCVGPILASVITLAITSQVNAAAAIITFAYALGTAIPMLFITYTGRQLFQRVPWLLANTKKIQQGFGVIMVLMAIGLFFNIDRNFQTYILEKFPSYGAGLTALEDNEQVRRQLDSLRTDSVTPELKSANQLAPDFTGGTEWFNSEPLSLHQHLRGSVVLVDFWTYSCINCIRTLPYLREWWTKYKDQGLVIVGVHSPEFQFEKKSQNVQEAIADFELTYPIIQDNNFTIWQAYSNRYWPAKYLVDQNGYIRYTHFGEGAYLETENAIRELLGLEPLSASDTQKLDIRKRQTPETYLGYERASSYTTQNRIEINRSIKYELGKALQLHEVGLQGEWLVADEYVEAQAPNAEIHLSFLAAQAYLVMEPPASGEGQVHVFLDGQLQEQIVIDQAKKYDLANVPYGEHIITLRFSRGVKAFAFTFGSS
ncbi:MAG TPA: cytochrome c biogenesis protein DipZ [Patescibacteria group bacterium]